MIIFGGRKGSGKTLFSTFLQEKGYVKISFATYLKEIISKLYSFDINKLFSEEGKSEILNIPLPWNEKIAQKLFDLTNINDYNFKINDTEFISRRDCMQYIGTNILRGYDDDFHIKKTISLLDKSKKYVCDDVRFKNELSALLAIQATSFFIIRPTYFEISNHDSEVSLKWNDFNNIIINNKPKDILLHDFNYKLNNNLFNNTLSITNGNCTFLNKFSDKNDEISGNTAYYAGVLFSLSTFNDSNYELNVASSNYSLILALKNFIDTRIKLSNNENQFKFSISNPFLIENLKHWNFKPKSKKIPYIPDIIKNDESLVKRWFEGIKAGGISN